jgi:hypothetical protein
MAVITGPVASGKTAILHELGARSSAAGVRLVWAGCTLAERSLDWGVADQILGRGAAERLTATEGATRSRRSVPPCSK